jgi:phage/plasmid-associated DNA primase
MWLRGGGADGKSSVQKAIESVIGRDQCYAMKEKDEAQNWFQKNVYGKVLVNYADCRNPYLVNNSSIKQLTGGDTTSIEGKGENAFTGKIYSKLFVTSNILPKINPEIRAHTSRLIKIDVLPQNEAKKDAGFEYRLQKEIYAFLASCRESFATYISGGGNELSLPHELKQKMWAECASDSYLHLQDFFEKYVVLGEGKMCKPSDMNRAIETFVKLEKHLPGNFVNPYLEEFKQKLEQHNCFQRRIEIGNVSQTMYLNFEIKPEALQ